MARSRNPSSRERSKPRVHVTYTGGLYVDPAELLHSPKVKEAIDTMAQIAQMDEGHRQVRTNEPTTPRAQPEAKKRCT